MKFFKKLKLFKSQLTRHLTLVFTGNIFAAFLVFLGILVISRTLSVSEFGLFNLSLSILLTVPFFAAFGIDTSVIKFISSYLGHNKTDEAFQVFKTSFGLRTLTSFIFSLVIFIAAPFISQRIFNYPNLIPLVRLVAFGTLFISLLNYIKSLLYAYKLFNRYVILQIILDIFKITAICTLLLLSKLNLFFVVMIFVLTPFLGTLLGSYQLRKILSSKGKPIKNLLKSMLSYSKWTFVSSMCHRTIMYAGIFMLAKMLNSKAAGIYGLALNLTHIFPIIIASLRSVLLPEVSRFKEISQFEKYVKNSLKISLIISAGAIPFLFFSRRLILFFFGLKYADSVVIFNWLLLSYLAYTINSIIRSALYSMNKPHVLAITDIFSLGAIILGTYLFIPRLGVLAPAIVWLFVNISCLTFFTIYLIKHFHREKFSPQIEKTAESLLY